MKAIEVRSLLNVKRNDEIIPAIEELLEPQQIKPPVTITLTFANGQYWSAVSGLSSPATAQQIELLQVICRRCADDLEQRRLALTTAEIRAAIEAESGVDTPPK